MRLPGRPPTVAVHILPSVTLPSAAATSDVPSRAIVAASFVLITATLLLIMWQGLLPGLLCVCVGFLATRWLARMLDLGLKRRAGASRAALAAPAPPAAVSSSGARIAAAVGPCIRQPSYEVGPDLRDAVLSYNRSQAYLTQVLRWKRTFESAELDQLSSLPAFSAWAV